MLLPIITSAWFFMIKKDIDKAKFYYKQAVQLDPGLSMAHFALGNIFFDLVDYDEALSCYQKAVELDPENALNHYHLALTYDKQGDIKSAIHEYIKAISIAPDNTYAIRNMIKGYLKLGKLEDLIDKFHKKSDTEPDDKIIYFCLGISYYYLVDFEKALKYLKKMEEESPKLPLLREYIADTLYKTNEIDKAIKLIRKLLVEEPYNVDLYYKLGCYLRKIKEPWQVKEPLMKISLLKPGSAIALTAQAMVNFDGNNAAEAERLAKFAGEKDPTFPDVYYMLGQILQKEGKKKQARRQFETVLKLDPTHIDAARAIQSLR